MFRKKTKQHNPGFLLINITTVFVFFLRRLRSTVSCTALLLWISPATNDIFVDIPWQQTAVGLLLPAGNTVAAVRPTQQTASDQTPTMTAQTLVLLSHLEPALNLRSITVTTCMHILLQLWAHPVRLFLFLPLISNGHLISQMMIQM